MTQFDGTDNFSRGILSYTVSIALVDTDRTLLGAVYEPYTQRLFFATKGGGATSNGRQIRVSATAELESATVALSTYSSFKAGGDQAWKVFTALVQRTDARITSSTALDLCNVACGALDARVMANSHIWDLCAAKLLIEEAGGRVTSWTARIGILNRASA